MADYSFYCVEPSGLAPHFEVQDHTSDEDALAAAKELLGGHPSATRIDVFVGEREVAKVTRAQVLGRVADGPGGIAAALDGWEPPHPDIAIIATTHDGAVQVWNPAAERLYGWSRSEVLGREVMDLTPAEESRTEATWIRRANPPGTSWQGEIVLRNKDGGSFRAFVAIFAFSDGVVGASAPADQRRLIDRGFAEIEAGLRSRLRR